MIKRVLLGLFVTILIASCAGQPTEIVSDSSEAKSALVNFLTLLNTKKYEEAVSLYGGDYEQLQIFNVDADPSDHVALWIYACDHQLLQCLKVRNTTFKEEQGNTSVFQVEFSNPDGSLFVLGPCCGADETEMPPVSQFEFKVTKTPQGKFLVMDMPPYVP